MKIVIRISLLLALSSILTLSCDKEEEKNTVSFNSNQIELVESETVQVTIALDKPLKKETTIYIKVINQGDIDYESDYTTNPVLENDTITLSIEKGQSTGTFTINTIFDHVVEEVETATFSIVDLSDELSFGSFSTMTLTIANKNSLREGLVGEYLFNGSADDTSINGNDGTVNGATLTTDRKNNPNTAYSFDGSNDNIIIPDNPALNFATNQDYSISLWVLASAQNDLSGTINDVFDKWSGDAQGYPFAFRYWNSTAASVDQAKVTAGRYDGAGCYGNPLFNSPNLSIGVYHHIVQLKTGSTLKLFFDNVLVSEINDNTICSTANNSPVTIGMRGQGARYFTGKVDDVRAYNRSLTESEIEALYNE